MSCTALRAPDALTFDFCTAVKKESVVSTLLNGNMSVVCIIFGHLLST